jgi:hypothetical protein
MSEVFTTFQLMIEHHEVIPPLVGQQVLIDSEDEDGGWYVYDGEEWTHTER